MNGKIFLEAIYAIQCIRIYNFKFDKKRIGMSLLDIMLQCVKNLEEEDQRQRKELPITSPSFSSQPPNVNEKKIQKFLYSPRNQAYSQRNSQNKAKELESKQLMLDQNLNSSFVSLPNKLEIVENTNYEQIQRIRSPQINNFFKNQDLMEEQPLSEQNFSSYQETEKIYKRVKILQDDEFLLPNMTSQYKLPQSRKIKKDEKVKKNNGEKFKCAKKVSKYFDPKPYVMRRIKHYIIEHNKNISIKTKNGESQLNEDYFRKNINQDFYRNVVFGKYCETIDKNKMFEEIRNQWISQQHTQQSKLILNELKRVQLQYTYDTKSIQKTMWNILITKFGFLGEPLSSFKKCNYKIINSTLRGLYLHHTHTSFMNSPMCNETTSFFPAQNHDIFWQYVHEQLREKNPLRYDPFILASIRDEYFGEGEQKE